MSWQCLKSNVMLKVQSHSAPYKVSNPAVPGQFNTMVNVVLIEEGRPGANKNLADSNAFLSGIFGENQGLSQVRTHTEPVLASTIGNYPIGKTFPGHINRILVTSPQIEQQVGRAPRMLDGKPTFFVTKLEAQAKDDVDERLPNAITAQLYPHYFTDAVVRVAEVTNLEGEELEEWEAAAGTPGTKTTKRGR